MLVLFRGTRFSCSAQGPSHTESRFEATWWLIWSIPHFGFNPRHFWGPFLSSRLWSKEMNHPFWHTKIPRKAFGKANYILFVKHMILFDFFLIILNFQAILSSKARAKRKCWLTIFASWSIALNSFLGDFPSPFKNAIDDSPNEAANRSKYFIPASYSTTSSVGHFVRGPAASGGDNSAQNWQAFRRPRYVYFYIKHSINHAPN